LEVWTFKDISKATKLQVYETMILSTLLYNSETWTLKTTQIIHSQAAVAMPLQEHLQGTKSSQVKA